MGSGEVRIQDLAAEIANRAEMSVEARVDAGYAILMILQSLQRISDSNAPQDLYDTQTFATSVRDMAIGDLVQSGYDGPKTDILTLKAWSELGVPQDPA